VQMLVLSIRLIFNILHSFELSNRLISVAIQTIVNEAWSILLTMIPSLVDRAHILANLGPISRHNVQVLVVDRPLRFISVLL
jgi:hypothetical protein